MHALGLELTGRGARAVVIDDEGAIQRRFEQSGSPLDECAREAVAAATRNRACDAIGIATHCEASRSVADGLVDVAAAQRFQVFAAGVAAITAEAWRGAAQNARHAVCLVIGDHVVAGVLIDGAPWPGAHGLAGSAAWLALNPVERQDYRRFGSLGAEVSAAGVARRLAWRVQAGDASAVVERAGGLEAITAAHVFDGARAGDGVAISVVRDTARYIAMAAANLACAIDPEVVVLGGAIAAAADLLLEPVRQQCARRLPPPMVDRFRCEISPFGEDGIAIGAARLAMTARR